MIKIYTIGFAGKRQDEFLEILNATDVKILADIRLWRVARFVPWASGANLAAGLGDRYKYMPELAPTKELLMDYKNGAIDWNEYEKTFNGILESRQAEKLFTAETLSGTCFLCAEKNADKCHRRLISEYLQNHFPEI